MTHSLGRLKTFALSAGILAALAACGGAPAAAPGSAPANVNPSGGSFAPPAERSGAPSARPATSAGSAGAGASGGSSASASAPSSSSSGSNGSAASAPAGAQPKASTGAGSATTAASGGAAGSSASATAGAVKLTLAPDTSQANITVREILAGKTVKTDAVESSKAVSGSITLDRTGAILPGSSLSLDLRTLKSDRGTRDNFIKGRFVLNTGQMPNAEFAPKSVQGLDGPLPTSGQKTFKLLGDATVHGVTKPLAWDVTATFDAQKVSGQATTSFNLSDFEINIPKVPSIVEVEDAAKVSLDFEAARAAA